MDWVGFGLNNIKQNMSWTFKKKKKTTTNRMHSMGFEPVTITCKYKDSTTKLGVNQLHFFSLVSFDRNLWLDICDFFFFVLRIWELNFLYIKFIVIVIICMCIVLHTKLIK